MNKKILRTLTALCAALMPVSYTHLDVYKRQGKNNAQRNIGNLRERND